MHRPPRLLTVVSAAWSLLLLTWISDSGVGFPAACAAVAGTALIAAAAIVHTWRARPAGRRLRGLLPWTPIVLAGAGCAAIFVGMQSPYNPLFRARFALSRQQLDAAAATVATQAQVPQPAWVGLFHVDVVDVREGEVRFLTNGCGIVDRCGLAFLPEGPRREYHKSRLTHLSGPWYHVYEIF